MSSLFSSLLSLHKAVETSALGVKDTESLLKTCLTLRRSLDKQSSALAEWEVEKRETKILIQNMKEKSQRMSQEIKHQQELLIRNKELSEKKDWAFLKKMEQIKEQVEIEREKYRVEIEALKRRNQLLEKKIQAFGLPE